MRAIDADKLLDSIRPEDENTALTAALMKDWKAKVRERIDKLPTITYEDLVPHGRWIKMDTTGLAAKENVWNCSVCGYPVGIWTAGCKYCPNCGAKMDLED